MGLEIWLGMGDTAELRSWTKMGDKSDKNDILLGSPHEYWFLDKMVDRGKMVIINCRFLYTYFAFFLYIFIVLCLF